MHLLPASAEVTAAGPGHKGHASLPGASPGARTRTAWHLVVGTMARVPVNSVAAMVFLLLAGCATAPGCRVAEQRPAAPAIVVRTTNVGAIKYRIISNMLEDGYRIERNAPYMLQMGRPVFGLEDLDATMAIGGGRSANSRVVRWTLVRSAHSVSIIAEPLLRARLPDGRVRWRSLRDDVAVRRALERRLTTLKAEIESGSYGRTGMLGGAK